MSNFITFRDDIITNAEIIKYPDGQHSVKLDLEKLDVKSKVYIKCCVKNWIDLEILACLIAALRKNDFDIWSIDFKYLFGLRSDRAFNPGEPNYMRDVLGKVIKSFEVPTVQIMQAHNYISAGYCGATSYSMLQNLVMTTSIDSALVAGDKSILELEGYDFLQRHHAAFSKKRKNGSFNISLDEGCQKLIKSIPEDHPIIIYDDLCDGGGTFIAEAQYLRDILNVKNPLHLIVTHGLFTKGLAPIYEYFDKIITTNSYQNLSYLPNRKLEVSDVYAN